MRLYNQLLAARGGLIDQMMMGCITAFGEELEKAQCFSLSKDVSLTCNDICQSKPSSMLGAIEQARAPYPHTWVEWSGPEREPGTKANSKVLPAKIGCLLITNKDGNRGVAILAWAHSKDLVDISLNPFGVLFDWSRSSARPVIDRYADRIGVDISKFKQTMDDYQQALTDTDRWSKHGTDKKELDAFIELDKMAAVIPLEFCLRWLKANNIVPGTERHNSYMDDLTGELIFIEAFLLLLNARNTIVSQTREDLTKLNKARARRRQAPLKEFITTSLKLSRVQSNRASAHGSHDAARAHLVRGHFKLRSSGVYWWSPHVRGTGKTVVRRQYDVAR